VSGSCCLYSCAGNEHESGCRFSCIHKPERLKCPRRSQLPLAERSSPARPASGRDALGRDACGRDAFANGLTPGLAADAVRGDGRMSPGDTGSIASAAASSNDSPWPSPPTRSGGSPERQPRLVPSSRAGSSQLLQMVHVI